MKIWTRCGLGAKKSDCKKSIVFLPQSIIFPPKFCAPRQVPFRRHPKCKMKPSCDQGTAYPFTYPIVTHLWFTSLKLTNLNIRHYWATRRINQSAFHLFWVTVSICESFVTLLLTCDTRVKYLWPICDPFMALLLFTCDCMYETLLKIAWNSLKI